MTKWKIPLRREAVRMGKKEHSESRNVGSFLDIPGCLPGVGTGFPYYKGANGALDPELRKDINYIYLGNHARRLRNADEPAVWGRAFEFEPRPNLRPDLAIRARLEVDGSPHRSLARVVNFQREAVPPADAGSAGGRDPNLKARSTY